jgi:hypothetical protein
VWKSAVFSPTNWGIEIFWGNIGGKSKKTGLKTPKIAFKCQMHISLQDTTYSFIEMQKNSRKFFIFGGNQVFSNVPRLL